MEWKVTEQGPRAVIEVWRRDEGDGLYKVWAAGQGGRFLLGTLLPESGRLCLRRTLSIDSLRQQGAWPVRRVEEELVCSFREQRPPAVQWEDEVLRRCARSLPRHTMRREGDVFTLIFPFDTRAPFPFAPIFCLARVENGRLLFSFRRGGVPYIPSERGENREELDSKRREHNGKSDHQGTERAGGPAGF